MANFEVLIFTMKHWKFETFYFVASDLKSSNTILPINRLQDALSRKTRQTDPGAQSAYFSKVWKLSATISTKKNCFQNWKKLRVHFFQSRPLVKVELTRECGKNTFNTGTKVTSDYQFEESIVLPKKHMPSIEAVWAMPSVRSCQTLSTAIREPIPNISDWRTSHYNCAAVFNGTKPEKNDQIHNKIA